MPLRVKIEVFFICGYDGIGRHAGFRFLCLRRAGSTPVTRTKNSKIAFAVLLFFYVIKGVGPEKGLSVKKTVQ